MAPSVASFADLLVSAVTEPGTLSAASASSTGEAARARPMQPAEDGELAPDRVFANCARARAAGAAPLYRGEPGYGPHLDGDGDGVACEPYPR